MINSVKLLCALFLLSFNSLVFSQITIENPEYIESNVNGTISKVELLKNATVLHFNVYLVPKKKAEIPKESYIKPVNSDEKYFATHAEGVTLGEKFLVPGDGKVSYKLYFPKLPEGVKAVDFDEFNRGTWEIKGLNIIPAPIPSIFTGNLLLADGSNRWMYGFYQNKVVANKKVWNYNTVINKGDYYTINLTRANEELSLIAKVNKNGTVSIGTDKKHLATLSKTKINNANVTFKDEISFDDAELLKSGTATYSGIIKNFGEHSKDKTGMLYVNNIFTGEQDSHLITINNDGSFSISFPSYHLQQVFVKLPGSYFAVYVEPGKEIWQLINSSDRSEGFFAGDLAQLNTDFASLSFMVFDSEFYNKIIKNIKNLSPQEYKEECFNYKTKELAQLDSIANTQFLSKSAYKLMALEIEYSAYENALSYDMHNDTPYEDRKSVNKAYMDFITPDILNNKKAILTVSYKSFINRLRFLKHLREGISVTHPNVVELGDMLKAENISLTSEEEALIALHNAYNEENKEAIQRQKDFNETHQETLKSFSKKYFSLYKKMTAEERKEYFNDSSVDFNVLEDYAKSKDMDVIFTEEEKAFQNESKNVLTKEEQERQKSFYSEENQKRNKAFTEKHKPYIEKYVNNQLRQKGIEKIREHLGFNFSTDVMVSQQILSSLSRNFIPLTDAELTESNDLVEESFIPQVFKIENDKLKAKIESNKSKTDFVVNETPKTDADKVFESIIEKYRGKVVFIDFWATWCGPCRSGMEKMKPLKVDLKDKDVEFVYITNQTSPQKTWDNMIPDIKGEHYRVSKDEWNYLSSKFNITGIPHYMLVNKEGKVVEDKIYFASDITKFKSLIDQHLVH